MGDMQDSGRGHGPRPDDLDGDPFAELARLVDEPWTGNPVGAQYHPSDAEIPAPAMSDEHWAQGSDEYAAPSEEVLGENFADSGEGFSETVAAGADEDVASLEDAFADAFAEEIHMDPIEPDGAGSGEAMRPAVPVFAASYSNWIAPRSAAQQRVHTARPAAPEEFDQALESELETALRGLSAPANPRGAALHHAQSFAPARIEMEEPAQAPSFSASPAIDDFDKLIESELAVMTVQGGFSGKERRVHAAPISAGVKPLPAGPAAHAAAAPSIEGEADAAAADGRFAIFPMSASGSSFLGRRAAALGGGVMALALLGTLGAFVWGGSGAEGTAVGEEVLLVKADPDPVKIVPEDPGGRDIPNQNKAVYERVQRAAPAAAPTQETLLTTADEPMDVPDEAEFRSADPLPGVELADVNDIGQEDRLAEINDGSPIPVLQPRRVRTVKVRADGTLVLDPLTVPETSMADLRSADVALTETASRPIDLAAAAGSAAAAEIASISDVVGSTGSVEPALRPGPVVPTPTPQASLAADPAAATVDVARAYAPVGTPATPAATAASSVGGAEGPVEATAPVDPNGYFVQISSQPSEVLAQDALRTLGARYSGLIGRRPMVIQPADIPGRGTYYRVRVAAASKDEASRLCDELKSAGGSCFVAR